MRRMSGVLLSILGFLLIGYVLSSEIVKLDGTGLGSFIFFSIASGVFIAIGGCLFFFRRQDRMSTAQRPAEYVPDKESVGYEPGSENPDVEEEGDVEVGAEDQEGEEDDEDGGLDESEAEEEDASEEEVELSVQDRAQKIADSRWRVIRVALGFDSEDISWRALILLESLEDSHVEILLDIRWCHKHSKGFFTLRDDQEVGFAFDDENFDPVDDPDDQVPADYLRVLAPFPAEEPTEAVESEVPPLS